MDALGTLAFYGIGLVVFLTIAWIIETIYFFITGRDEPANNSHKAGSDYRRHK